jgi:hypothetical protein
MAEAKTDAKGWAETCVDGVSAKVPDVVCATLKEQLKGVMQERPLKSSELTNLSTALLGPPKEPDPEEKGA